MSCNTDLARPGHRFPGLNRLLALIHRDKPVLSRPRGRGEALDDPRTRRALAHLPPHILRDIGVTDNRADDAAPADEGDALRRHFW